MIVSLSRKIVRGFKWVVRNVTLWVLVTVVVIVVVASGVRFDQPDPPPPTLKFDTRDLNKTFVWTTYYVRMMHNFCTVAKPPEWVTNEEAKIMRIFRVYVGRYVEWKVDVVRVSPEGAIVSGWRSANLTHEATFECETMLNIIPSPNGMSGRSTYDPERSPLMIPYEGVIRSGQSATLRGYVDSFKLSADPYAKARHLYNRTTLDIFLINCTLTSE